MPKIQSALEYLMTYGWAILIIAVVMGAVFGLGLFNTSSLAPKAAAGSCSVARPNGPLTTQFINLEGVCNNELPQYVGSFSGSGFVTVQNVKGLVGTANQITMTEWVYSKSSGSNAGAAVDVYGDPSGYLTFDTYGCLSGGTGGVAFWLSDTNGNCNPDFAYGSLENNWIFVVVSYDGSNLNGWVCMNGSCAEPTSYATSSNVPVTGNVQIGGMQEGIYGWGSWDGYLANLQIYNTSFSANDVTTLYHEGIGGAPIALPWLVGWWPLNGDVNDYSGNGYNGPANGIVFTNSWTSGYSAP